MMILRAILAVSLFGYISCQSSLASSSGSVSASASASGGDETTVAMDDGTTDYAGGMATNNAAVAGTSSVGGGGGGVGGSSTAVTATTTASSTSTTSTSTVSTCTSCSAKVSDTTCGTDSADATDSTSETCTGGCWFAKFYNSTDTTWSYIRGCLTSTNKDKYGLASSTTACTDHVDWSCQQGTHVAWTKCCTGTNCNVGFTATTTTQCGKASTAVVSSLAVYLMIVLLQKLC